MAHSRPPSAWPAHALSTSLGRASPPARRAALASRRVGRTENVTSQLRFTAVPNASSSSESHRMLWRARPGTVVRASRLARVLVPPDPGTSRSRRSWRS